MSEPRSEDELEPQYQSGETQVQHRNIDAAGTEHPFGNEPRSFEADLRHLLRKVADELYQSWEATIREYEANAETATLKVQEYANDPSSSMYDDMIVDDSYQPKIEVEWNKQENKVIIQDNGIGMAAQEVDEIFRQIGHSAARDDGSKSGKFGMGALSFAKLIGVDNAMIMTSHSRLNDDNAAYYITLAGVEPIQGQLPDDQYGTVFQMTPADDYDIRQAVETYSEWMRVPVRYEEIGDDGSVEFQEDYGNKSLYDEYGDHRACLGIRKSGAFEAYASPDATGKTLLLSMDIERNDGNQSVRQHGSPFPFDVRLLDEGGTIIESSNGNEGLMPIVDSDYEEMLVNARHPYITERLLNNKDIIGQELVESEDVSHEGSTVVSDDVYEQIQAGEVHVPPGEYLPRSDLHGWETPGEARVIFGPNKGKIVVGEDEWNDMEQGRAEMYVPESELEEYDLEEGTGDLQLPQPTSDRDRLQEHPVFWQYLGQQFAEQFDEKVEEVYNRLDTSEDALETIQQLEPDELVVTPEGFEE